MSIQIQNISYQFPDGKVLFSEISASIQNESKIALIGDNGCGKSTLLHLISDTSQLQSGSILQSDKPFLVPQNMNPYLNQNVGEILLVNAKIDALQRILAGEVDENLYEILDDDWTIEERVSAQLDFWGLSNVTLDTKLQNLSGGERVKVFLTGLTLNTPSTVF